MQTADAWSAVAELAASQHGTFHRRQAAELHLTSKSLLGAVRRGSLRQPSRDVFTFTSVPPSWHQDLMVQSMNGSAVSHRSAAKLHRLDGFNYAKNVVVEVSRSDGLSTRASGAIVHRMKGLDAQHITVVDGIRCTSVALTLVHLGAVTSPSKVEQALDSALRLGASPTWIAETLDKARRSGRNGCGVLAAILDDPGRSGALPDSWFERRLVKLLIDAGLPKPVLQYKVGRRRLDLAFPDAKLGIEAHSRQFHFGHQQEESDNERDIEIGAHGWDVMYVTWAMAQDPASLVRKVVALYRARIANAAA